MYEFTICLLVLRLKSTIFFIEREKNTKRRKVQKNAINCYQEKVAYIEKT